MTTQIHACDIISHLPYFVIVTNSDGIINFANKEAGRIFGRNKLDLLGAAINEIIKPFPEPLLKNTINSIVEEDKSWKGELVVPVDENSQVMIEISATKLKSRDDSLKESMIVYSGQDITESRHQQRKSNQDDRSGIRGEMAGEISHELNNYLSIVMGNLELMGMAVDKGKFDSLGSRMKGMKDGINRIVKFVEGLMSVTRPEQKSEIIDINQFVQNELFFLKSQPRFKDIDLVIESDTSIPQIEVDSSRLQHALFNIFENAREALQEASSDEKRIRVVTSFAESDNRVRLSISDNGCGMSTEDYQRVFRQFFSTKGTGHGFGLLAVKGAIKSHGGKVYASPAPEGGACFTLEFPPKESTPKPQPVMATA
jgi:PAS domain S-box-containing protein